MTETEEAVWKNIAENPGEKIINIIRYYAHGDLPVKRIVVSSEIFDRTLLQARMNAKSAADHVLWIKQAIADGRFVYFGIEVSMDPALDLCDVPFAVMYE